MKLYGVPLLLILLALLVGPGCSSVTSTYPLSLDPKPIVKEKFEGVWLMKNDNYHMPLQVKFTDNGLLKIAFLDWKENDFCVERAEAMVIQGKKHNFFSVRYQECFGEWDGYYFAPYKFTDQGYLILWEPDLGVFKKMNENKKLLDIVQNGDYSDKITITNAPGALLKFLNDPDNLELFDYREPLVLKKIAADHHADEQSAAGDVQKAAPEE